MKRFLFCIAILFALPAYAQEEEVDAGGASGLPVPRFVSLKSDEINVRDGPGLRYAIRWIYRREGYPVEIVREFNLWREIRDIEGNTGWVHRNMLDGRRHIIVKGATQTLHRAPDETSPALLKAQSGVIGKLMECSVDWCRVQIESRKGWLLKDQMWGVYRNEIIGD